MSAVSPADADLLDIAEVARRSGLSASALRFYEEKGLIASCGRRGLRRQYASNVVARLGFVLTACEAGLQLDEIAALLGAASEQEVRRRMAEVHDRLLQQIDRLVAVREGFAHVDTCCAARLLDCPEFSSAMQSLLPGGAHVTEE